MPFLIDIQAAIKFPHCWTCLFFRKLRWVWHSKTKFPEIPLRLFAVIFKHACVFFGAVSSILCSRLDFQTIHPPTCPPSEHLLSEHLFCQALCFPCTIPSTCGRKDPVRRGLSWMSMGNGDGQNPLRTRSKGAHWAWGLLKSSSSKMAELGPQKCHLFPKAPFQMFNYKNSHYSLYIYKKNKNSNPKTNKNHHYQQNPTKSDTASQQ